MDGGADLTTLFKRDKFFVKREPERCPRHGSGDTELGWWNRRCAPDARKRVRTCVIEFGNVEPTQVRSLTRHSISFKKPPKPKTRWIVSGSGGLCHDLGLCKTRSWVSGVNLGMAYRPKPARTARKRTPTREPGAWCGLQSLFRVCQTVLGQPWNSERLMNSLKPTGGWMGTLGEGETNTVGRVELMACVVAAESTRGNVVYVTDNQILKKRQDSCWPTPCLGHGSNPDLWWRLSRALKTRQGTF